MVRSTLQKLLRLLAKRHIQAVLDQMILSAASFLTAFVVIRIAGVSAFGTYSFMLAICLLVQQTLASLLHGQMVLRVAGSPRRVQNATLRATTWANLALFMVIVVAAIALGSFFPAARAFALDHATECLAAALFMLLQSQFELFRRFLYVVARQDYSLTCTVVYLGMLVFGLLLMYLLGSESTTVSLVFLVYAIALLAAIAVNRLAWQSLGAGRGLRMRIVWTLFKRYFAQGRFGFAGILVSWAQNQGITPLLMWIAGPTVVGQFNIARILVSPINIVNTGVSGSALPRLREHYKRAQHTRIVDEISSLARSNLLFSLAYFGVLFLLGLVGFLDRFIPDFDGVKNFLIGWSLVTIAIIYRQWLTTYFVCAMQFKLLLIAGVATTSLSFALMFLLRIGGASYYLLPACILVAECVLYVSLKRKQTAAVRSVQIG